jgi:hypothetical protein
VKEFDAIRFHTSKDRDRIAPFPDTVDGSKYVSTVDVAEFRKEVDRLSKGYWELDASIQVANGTVEMDELL